MAIRLSMLAQNRVRCIPPSIMENRGQNSQASKTYHRKETGPFRHDRKPTLFAGLRQARAMKIILAYRLKQAPLFIRTIMGKPGMIGQERVRLMYIRYSNTQMHQLVCMLQTAMVRPTLKKGTRKVMTVVKLGLI